MDNSVNELLEKAKKWSDTWPKFGMESSTNKSKQKIKPNTEAKKAIKSFDTQYGVLSDTNENSASLSIQIPIFGINEIINERTIWQKQLYTIGAEQGWFYFKIFFDFNNKCGLLGNTLDTKIDEFNALHYLHQLDGLYLTENIPSRIIALKKFASTLHSIQTDTPWLFRGINGLDAINGTCITDHAKEETIEIVFNNETTDTRIGSLIDFYKYACFDTMNCKEIIPENLRLFNMSILIYHVPIAGFQTDIYSDGKLVSPAKATVNSKPGIDNLMSYKLYNFTGCEIKLDGIQSYVQNQINNETAFVLGNNTLKIKFKRCYQYRMNEFNELLMGDPGILENNEPTPGMNMQYRTFPGTRGMKHDYITDTLNHVDDNKDTEISKRTINPALYNSMNQSFKFNNNILNQQRNLVSSL